MQHKTGSQIANVALKGLSVLSVARVVRVVIVDVAAASAAVVVGGAGVDRRERSSLRQDCLVLAPNRHKREEGNHDNHEAAEGNRNGTSSIADRIGIILVVLANDVVGMATNKVHLGNNEAAQHEVDNRVGNDAELAGILEGASAAVHKAEDNDDDGVNDSSGGHGNNANQVAPGNRVRNLEAQRGPFEEGSNIAVGGVTGVIDVFDAPCRNGNEDNKQADVDDVKNTTASRVEAPRRTRNWPCGSSSGRCRRDSSV